MTLPICAWLLTGSGTVAQRRIFGRGSKNEEMMKIPTLAQVLTVIRCAGIARAVQLANRLSDN
jgi:hypothetical protein